MSDNLNMARSPLNRLTGIGAILSPAPNDRAPNTPAAAGSVAYPLRRALEDRLLAMAEVVNLSPDARTSLFEGIYDTITSAGHEFQDQPREGADAENVTVRRGVNGDSRGTTTGDRDAAPVNHALRRRTLAGRDDRHDDADPDDAGLACAMSGVDYVKKRKEPTFDTSLTYSQGKGWASSIKMVYDHLEAYQMSYVLDTGTNPVCPNKVDEARAIAAERQEIMVGSRTAYQVDQTWVFNILQKAFMAAHPDVFDDIAAGDDDSGTLAYEGLREEINPINADIQDDYKAKLKQFATLPWTEGDATSRIRQIKHYRRELKAKGKAIHAYKILRWTIAAARAFGPTSHWALWADRGDVDAFEKLGKTAFTEAHLQRFFQLMLEREVKFKGTKNSVDPKSVTTESSHLADAKKSKDFFYCPWHERKVKHKPEDCSLNPKNKPGATQNGDKTARSFGDKSKAPDEDNETMTKANTAMNRITCYHCHNVGHIKARCPKLAEAKIAEANLAEDDTTEECLTAEALDFTPLGLLDLPCDVLTMIGALVTKPDPWDIYLNPLVRKMGIESARKGLPSAFDQQLLEQGGFLAEPLGTADLPSADFWRKLEDLDAAILAGAYDYLDADPPCPPSLAALPDDGPDDDRFSREISDGPNSDGENSDGPTSARAEWDYSFLYDARLEANVFDYYAELSYSHAAYIASPKTTNDRRAEWDYSFLYDARLEANVFDYYAELSYSHAACIATDGTEEVQEGLAVSTGDFEEAVVDSGATITLLRRRDRFENGTFLPCQTPINTAGSQSITASGRGIAHFRIVDPDNANSSLEVKIDALLCPDLRRDLLSVPGLSQAGCTTQFGPDGAFLVDSAGDNAVKLMQRGRLWLAKLDPNPFAGAVTHLSQEQIWHLRFNHVNSQVLARASLQLRNMPALRSVEECPCHDCIIAKARKAGPGNLGVLLSEVNSPLELVFLDNSGPMRTQALGPHGKPGVRYSLIIVDAFQPRKKWDIPLHAKSDTPSAFESWVIAVQALVPLKVKRVHTDQGGEFTSKAFAAVCAKYGILHHYSCAYEPRQNGVVERAIGTLTRYARAMMATSCAPLRLWWFARAYSAEVVNVLPFYGHMSADEAFFQERQDANLFFPFGCWCYVHKPRALADDSKWDASGEEGIFVGTGSTVGMRAFAVYTRSGKIVYAVSVRLDMTYFPFRPRGQQRIDADYFKEAVHTDCEASWDPNGGPLPASDAVFVPMLAEEGEYSYGEPSWTDRTDAEPRLAGVEHHIDSIDAAIDRAKAQLKKQHEADDNGNHDDDKAPAPNADDGCSKVKTVTWRPDDDDAGKSGATATRGDDDKTTTAAATARGGDGVHDKTDDGVKDGELDLYLPDGKWAPHLIGRRVTKFYKRNGRTYHGEVTDIEQRPQNKRDKVVFHCHFEEDDDYDTFTYAALLKILDDEMPEEFANVADAAVDDAKKEFLPDVVPSRAEMLLQDDRDKFIEAEAVEIENQEKHQVLEWCPLPKHARAIGSKFTYKRKRDEHGNIVKWKARLVAQGYSMRFGIDYHHSSSPVATMTSFRLVLVIAMTHGMDVTAGDIDGAFLNASLSEDSGMDEALYMRPPRGFEDPTGQGRVFLLKKSIYGLKNASYCWHKLLSSTMAELGYRPVDGTECLWLYDDGAQKALFSVHVDDYIHAFTSRDLDEKLVAKFTELWGVSNVGPISYHLGMRVQYAKGEYVIINQRPFFEKVLKRFGYEGMKSVESPMDSTLKISLEESTPGDALGEDDKRLYMEIVGSLIYGAVTSRPDIANSVAQLGRVMNKPSKQHMHAAKRVLRYVAGTLDRGLVYRNAPWTAPGLDGDMAPGKLVVYADSDWAGCIDTRKSTSGYLAFLAGGVISYRATLQKIQALSSAEAEYVALSDAAREIEYISNVLKEMDLLPQEGPIPLLTDSSAALAMTQQKGVNHRTKHIALRYHYIRSLVDSGLFSVSKIDTAENPADLLTKATDRVTFVKHADLCVPCAGQ